MVKVYSSLNTSITTSGYRNGVIIMVSLSLVTVTSLQ